MELHINSLIMVTLLMSLNFSDMIYHITLKLSDMIDPVTMICDFMQSFIRL